MATGPKFLPKSEQEHNEWIYSKLRNQAQAGFIFGFVVLAGTLVLYHTQDIIAFLRLTGRMLGQGRKLSGSQLSRVEPIIPIHVTIFSATASRVLKSASVAEASLTNIPPSSPDFIARYRELQILEASLAPESAQVVIHGLPGVGKTALALHYGYTHGASYPGGVWWLDASHGFESLCTAAVSDLEARFSLPSVEGLSLEARLRRCFQAWPGDAEDSVLLVVDNVPSPPEGLELVRRLTIGLPERFRCLLTQRAYPPAHINALKITDLTSDEALELLKIRSGESGRRRIEHEPQDAASLVEAVDGLPLALVLLAGRLQRVPTLRVSDLLEDLSRHGLRTAAFQENSTNDLREPAMEATMRTSWDTLGPEAMELARLLSLTLPAPIPWELIERCVPSGLPTIPRTVNCYWDDALAELVGANLLDALDGDHPLYVLHPLVRQFFSLQRRGWELEAFWREQLCAAAQVLARQWEEKDLEIVVEYWRQAANAEPSDTRATFGLGTALRTLGDTAGATQAFDQCLRNAEAASDEQGQANALVGIGDVLVSQGDGPGALAAYQAGLAIVEGLVKRDPANTQWLHDLSLSNDRMGDVLVLQGDGPGALAAYQAALAIAQDLAERDHANTQWQRDLTVSHIKIADVLVAQGDRPGALAAYRAGLAIAEGLAMCDPANTQWQRDLFVSNIKIGDVLLSQGDGSGALSAYQASLTIAEGLAMRDPANTQWQRDLFVSNNKIGDVLIAQRNGPGALAAYREGLMTAEDLAKRDPANTQWQRDLSVSHDRIGDVLVTQGDSPGALAAYQAGLAIRENLSKRDPDNTQWQRDLLISFDRSGDVLVAQGDGPGALAAYRAGLAIVEGLAKRDPTNTQWQHHRFLCINKIGDVLLSQEDGPGAVAAYQAGLAIAEGLAKRDPTDTKLQCDLLTSQEKMAAALTLQRRFLEAHAAYKASSAIRNNLRTHDPSTTLWQNFLTVSNIRTGEVLAPLGDKAASLAIYRKIAGILTEKGAYKSCQRCGCGDFSIITEPTNLSLNEGLTRERILGSLSMPVIITVCANCGAVNFHALDVLGLTPEHLLADKGT